MALMTVCPACTTYFKVVSDQLLLHHGMVRCGSCDHVFNANDRLEALAEGTYAETLLIRNNFSHKVIPRTHQAEKSATQLLIQDSIVSNQVASTHPSMSLGTAFTELKLDTPSALEFFSPKNTGTDYDIFNVKLPDVKLPDINLISNISNTLGISDKMLSDKLKPSSHTSISPFFTASDSNHLNNPNTSNSLNLPEPSKSQLSTITATTENLELSEQLEQQKKYAANRRSEIKARQLLEAESKAKLLKANVDKQISTHLKNSTALPKKSVSNYSATKRRPKKTVKPAKPSFWIASRLILNRLLTILLISITGLLGVTLLLQILLWVRYPVMNALPVTTVVFKHLCSVTGCIYTPAVWLKPLSLDGISLNKLPNNTSTTAGMATYRMQATIRNTSHLDIRSPDIELTISTLEGAILAKKILPAYVFPPVPASLGSIPANTDWIIDIPINLDENTINYAARMVYRL
ncbi:MAG: hypothetical protein RL344_677 [Pseudomonadota bacterium]|jgi:predicted Zn finger-like uncharacterized protein